MLTLTPTLTLPLTLTLAICLASAQVMVKRVPGLLLLRVDGKKQSFNVKATNLTHRIHHLSFGHSDDRMNSAARRLLPSLQGRGLPAHVTRGGAPLDGDEFASTGKHESHEHFLKVVRTTFRPLSQDLVDMYAPHRHGPRPWPTYSLSALPA